MKMIDLLNELGSTTEEVAKNLLLKEIKGKKTAHISCPIANYIKSFETIDNFPILLIGVNRCQIAWTEILPNCYLVSQCMITPLPIHDFVADFDAGKYSELED